MFSEIMKYLLVYNKQDLTLAFIKKKGKGCLILFVLP